MALGFFNKVPFSDLLNSSRGSLVIATMTLDGGDYEWRTGPELTFMISFFDGSN